MRSKGQGKGEVMDNHHGLTKVGIAARASKNCFGWAKVANIFLFRRFFCLIQEGVWGILTWVGSQPENQAGRLDLTEK